MPIELPVTPRVTVDIIIELAEKPGMIVLIERVNPPHGLAIPGGFVEVGETTMHAAIREAEEETGLRITDVKQFHTYSSPGRDPRGHGITVCYTATAMGRPKAADDAKRIYYYNRYDKEVVTSSFEVESQSPWYNSNHLCFDHGAMLVDYIIWKDTGELPTRE